MLSARKISGASGEASGRPSSADGVAAAVQCRLQPVEERDLRILHVPPRLARIEPFDLVDLGVGADLAGEWRPLEREGVAVRLSRIQVALGRPSVNHLAAALGYRPELDERAFRHGMAGLLLELPAGRGRQVRLVEVGLALGDGPAAQVLVAEEGAARVPEQHLQAIAPAAEEEDAGASACRHRRRVGEPGERRPRGRTAPAGVGAPDAGASAPDPAAGRTQLSRAAQPSGSAGRALVGPGDRLPIAVPQTARIAQGAAEEEFDLGVEAAQVVAGELAQRGHHLWVQAQQEGDAFCHVQHPDAGERPARAGRRSLPISWAIIPGRACRR